MFRMVLVILGVGVWGDWGVVLDDVDELEVIGAECAGCSECRTSKSVDFFVA